MESSSGNVRSEPNWGDPVSLGSFCSICALRRSANRTALADVRGEQRHGQKSLLDVLNAEREQIEAEVKLIETWRDLVRASYAPLASMGQLKTVALKAAARG
jgi:outer membrane protein TolC